MNAQHGFAVICALVLAGGSASGESIIHDASNFSFAGSSISSLVLANDFQVASATSPATASAWLIETTPDIPGVFEGFSGTLGWAIYASAGSFPSTMPLAVGSDASPVLTDVGDDLGGQDVFRRHRPCRFTLQRLAGTRSGHVLVCSARRQLLLARRRQRNPLAVEPRRCNGHTSGLTSTRRPPERPGWISESTTTMPFGSLPCRNRRLPHWPPAA